MSLEHCMFAPVSEVCGKVVSGIGQGFGLGGYVCLTGMIDRIEDASSIKRGCFPLAIGGQ